jgi:hypothetical protein
MTNFALLLGPQLSIPAACGTTFAMVHTNHISAAIGLSPSCVCVWLLVFLQLFSALGGNAGIFGPKHNRPLIR